jgi:hypothetical protein
VTPHDRTFCTGSDPGVRPHSDQSESPQRFDPSSRSRLTAHDLGRFTGDTLFDRLARAVCSAGCLPRRELYEAWEVARRVRRHFRGGRIVDLAGGHGLLAQALLLLDATSPEALVVDRKIPPSSAPLHQSLVAQWPRLADRVRFISADLGGIDLSAGDLVVASHACGALTDAVLKRAADVHARVAVLPCCHDLASCDTGAVGGWLEASLAVDVVRAVNLERRGYRVSTLLIPPAITASNRLLLGEPRLG